MLGVSFAITDNGTYKIGAWSKKNYFEITRPIGLRASCNEGFTVKPWVYGEIPVIEYANERNILGDSFGCFEAVIPILDELNTVNSDRANDIAQFVQSLLWFHNCELDEDQKKQIVDGNGMIVTKSAGDGRNAKITYLTQTLNQSEIQSEQSERRAIKMMLAIARHEKNKDDADIGSLRVSDVGIKFSRNKTYNLTDKVNAWATMLKNGADPLRATEIASFTTDPQQFTVDSMEMIKKIQESYATSDSSATDATKPDADKIMQDNSDQSKNSPLSGKL